MDARALLLTERVIVLCVYAARMHVHVRSIINQIIVKPEDYPLGTLVPCDFDN